MIFFNKDKGDKGRGKSDPKAEREERIRKLRDESNEHLKKGQTGKALDSTRALTQLDPRNPDWRRRLADLYRTLGQRSEELDARCHAATLYAESGFLLKGIAMCKMALALDPEHEATQKKLAELNGEATPKPATPRTTGSPFQKPHATFGKKPAAPIEPDTPSDGVPPPPASLPPGKPLEDVPLKSLVPAVPQPNGESDPPNKEEHAPESDDEVYILDLDDVEIAENEGEAQDNEAAQEAQKAPRRDALRSAIERTPLLSDLNEASFVKLIETVQFCELDESEVVFRQGDAADAMYVVVEGEVAATLESPNKVELARLGEGEFFGEIGLLANQPRQATITATRPTQVLRFERELVSSMEASEPEFIRILLRFVRERLVASLIATSPLFAPFSGPEAEDLTRRFRFLEVKGRKALVRQGKPSGGVYILLTGAAKVVQVGDKETRELSRLVPGEIFGEMSLIFNEAAVATVVTTAKSFVLQLPASDFTQLIMMHPMVLDHVSTLAGERRAKNAGGADERIELL